MKEIYLEFFEKFSYPSELSTFEKNNFTLVDYRLNAIEEMANTVPVINQRHETRNR